MKNILQSGYSTTQSATVDCVPITTMINSQLHEYIVTFLKIKINIWYNGGYSLVQTAEILITKPEMERSLTHKIASTSSVQPYSSFLNVSNLRNCSSFTPQMLEKFSFTAASFSFSSIFWLLSQIISYHKLYKTEDQHENFALY
ncbi:uncharacterized protein LOC143242793 [Tachypleus tridentatus]|uniref:uncharacterized protein LOC143242793 n=1 Tax=Tachypleus tridentatus TaxID=6853 RepID=UPI003FD64795